MTSSVLMPLPLAIFFIACAVAVTGYVFVRTCQAIAEGLSHGGRRRGNKDPRLQMRYQKGYREMERDRRWGG